MLLRAVKTARHISTRHLAHRALLAQRDLDVLSRNCFGVEVGPLGILELENTLGFAAKKVGLALLHIGSEFQIALL